MHTTVPADDERVVGAEATPPRPGFLGLYHPDPELDQYGATVPMAPGRLGATVGRDTRTEAGQPLGDPAMSRSHATVRWSGQDGVFLQDHSSHGATWINGVRLGKDQEAPLVSGDQVRFGNTLVAWRDDLTPFLDGEPPDALSREIVGTSVAMREVRAKSREAARGTYPLLLLGPPGVGKTQLGRAIHAISRRGGKYRVVACTTLQTDLARAELFGNLAHAYTGAANRVGLLKLDKGSTVLFDEFAELPLDLQGALLEVLQDRQIRPIGTNDPVTFQARVLAATNVDLAKALADKTLRQDLYHRLHADAVCIPPLVARREDVPALVRCFLAREGRAEARPSVHAMTRMVLAGWPDNARGLLHVVKMLCNQEGPELSWNESLETRIAGVPPSCYPDAEELATAASARLAPAASCRPRIRRGPLTAAEVQHALRLSGGNKAAAARILNVNRGSLYRWLAKERERQGQARDAAG